ncbi:hypothetical protein F5887DRAFT_1077121 [Amanita rubescens]|nr:hypothetical protein F5887DRAFT_1077121 [Amanita rubescens]
MPKELRDTKLNSPGALRGSRHLPYPNPLWRPSVGFRLSQLIGSAYEHTRTPGKSIPGINSTQHVEKPSTKVKTKAPTTSRSLLRRATNVDSISELTAHPDEHMFGSSLNLSTQSVSRDVTQFKATHAPRVKREVLRTSKSPGESTVTPVVETRRFGQTPTRTRPKSDWPELCKPMSEIQLATRREDSLRVLNNARRTRDLTLESRNTQRRVQTLTRTQERPSSLKSDLTPASCELQRNSPSKPNEPAIARGLDPRGKLPSESSKTESSVSHTPSRKSDTRDKRIPPPVLKPSVLVWKLPDKSARVVGNSSKSQVVAVATRCVPIPRAESKLKSQIGNKKVSTKEQESTINYAPSSETALSLSKSLPVTSIRASPPVLVKDELVLAPSWLPKRHESCVVSLKSAVSKTTHSKDKTCPRTSSQTGNPRFGEPHAARESEQFKRAVEAKGNSRLLPETPAEQTSACSSNDLGLVSAPVLISSFSSEMGEERLDSYAHLRCLFPVPPLARYHPVQFINLLLRWYQYDVI